MAVKAGKVEKAAKHAAKTVKQKLPNNKAAAAPAAQKLLNKKKVLPPPPPPPPPVFDYKSKPPTVPKHLLLPTKTKRIGKARGGIGGGHDYLHGVVSAYFPLIWLLTSLLFWTWFIMRRFVRPKGRLPPGPIGRPLVGVVGSQLALPPSTTAKGGAVVDDPLPYKTLTEWAKKYGSIYSFFSGPSQLVVVLNDYDVIKAAFVDQADVFNGRPRNSVQRELSNNGYGVGVAEGEFWQDQRRFLQRSFDALVKPGSKFELLCTDEALALVREFQQNSSSGFDPRTAVETSAANILFAMCYGRRLDRDAPLLRKIINNTLNVSQLAGQSTNSLSESIPLLRYLQPYKLREERLKEATALQRQLLAPEIARIREVYEGSGEARVQSGVAETGDPASLVEHFLAQRTKLKNPDASRMFCMDNILTNIQNMFVAGFEPLIASILWSLLHLTRQPNLQQKLYTEIAGKLPSSSTTSNNTHKRTLEAANNDDFFDDEEGAQSAITWADRAALTSGDAFQQEVLRRTSVMPLGMPHRTIADTKLGQYFIPKDTLVIANLHAASLQLGGGASSTDLFFKPERFISSSATNGEVVGAGKAKGSSQQQLPVALGIGKRTCVAGESIVRMSLFIVTMNIVKQLEIRQQPTWAASSARTVVASDQQSGGRGAGNVVVKPGEKQQQQYVQAGTLYPAAFEIVAKTRRDEGGAAAVVAGGKGDDDIVFPGGAISKVVV